MSTKVLSFAFAAFAASKATESGWNFTLEANVIANILGFKFLTSGKGVIYLCILTDAVIATTSYKEKTTKQTTYCMSLQTAAELLCKTNVAYVNGISCTTIEQFTTELEKPNAQATFVLQTGQQVRLVTNATASLTVEAQAPPAQQQGVWGKVGG